MLLVTQPTDSPAGKETIISRPLMMYSTNHEPLDWLTHREKKKNRTINASFFIFKFRGFDWQRFHEKEDCTNYNGIKIFILSEGEFIIGIKNFVFNLPAAQSTEALFNYHPQTAAGELINVFIWFQ